MSWKRYNPKRPPPPGLYLVYFAEPRQGLEDLGPWIGMLLPEGMVAVGGFYTDAQYITHYAPRPTPPPRDEHSLSPK